MIKVNLLPVKTRKKSAHGDLILFVVMLVVGFGSVGAVYFKNVRDISNTRSEIARSKEAVAALQGVYKDYQTIQKEKKEIGKLELKLFFRNR